MCEEKFSLFHPIELGFVVAALYSVLDGQFVTRFPSTNSHTLFRRFFPEYYLVLCFLIAAIGQYLHFAIIVIDQMTTYLKIRCLHIVPKKVE